MSATVELPKWQCHKVVEAAKITAAVRGQGSSIVLTLEGGLAATVDVAYLNRSNPSGELVGGYFVRYADGYEAWSPAKAFEEGYARYYEVTVGASGPSVEFLSTEEFAKRFGPRRVGVEPPGPLRRLWRFLFGVDSAR